MRMRQASAIRWCVVLAPILALHGLAAAQGVSQLTHFPSAKQGLGAIDDAGSVIFVNSSTNQLGNNGDHIFQIFGFDPSTGTGQQVTDFEIGVTEWQHGLSVSDDGQWVAFLSAGDPTGQNDDASRELFVMAADGTQIAQLTSDTSVLAGSVSFFAIAGNGASLVFASSSDLTGGNPDHLWQIFKVNRDGTGLAQVTSGDIGILSDLAVSDDGQHIVYTSNGDPTGGNADGTTEVFAIDAAGTNLRQLTSDASENSLRSVISGNGSLIVFESRADHVGLNPDGHDEIFAVEWDGTGLRQVSRADTDFAAYPSVTDDGEWIVFYSSQHVGTMNQDFNWEIWKIRSDGTDLGLITDLNNAPLFAFPRISGSGNQVVFMVIAGQIPGGANPDDNWELHTAAFDGSGLHQLTFTLEVRVEAPDISPDGSRIVFQSDADPLGTNPSHDEQIFRIQTDGSGLDQVTSFSGPWWIERPAVAGNNRTVVFAYNGNPVGGNGDLSPEIFKVDTETGLVTQLTLGNSTWSTFLHAPDIAADGSAVVFASGANPTGGNADGGLDVFRMGADGSGVVQLTSGGGGEFSFLPRVSADGSWCTFQSNGDFSGANGDGSYEVFRVRATDGGQLQQISIGHDSFTEPTPDISGDGNLIVYSSSSDPLGTNPEGNFEIFLYDASDLTTRQLTSYAEGDSSKPRISQDGSFVYFISSAPVFEDDPDRPVDLYGVDVATGIVVRVGAERGTVNAYDVWLSHLSADATGRRAAFTGQGDFVRENPDANPEVWLIDREAPQRMLPDGPAPTMLSWDYDAGPVRYDVIRGDLSQLSADVSSVDLGPTICLDDDSPDASTSGSEDIEDPLPGQGFFYLYRGSQGVAAGPGSWGYATGDKPRVGGACAGTSP